MRVLVCGGRDFNDYAMAAKVLCAVRDEHGVTAIIEGGAVGADWCAGLWAKAAGVEHLTFRADWKTHGRRAGPIRNQQMLDEGKPDLVVAFPGGRGTADMVARARKAGVRVIVVPSPKKDDER